MPRTGGVYSPPAGTKGVSNTTIQSVPYNAFVDDLTDDANAARPVTAGGTGATTASGARTALGLAIGTNVQAYDAGLQSIAGLTTSADKMIYTTAADAYATTALTPFARTILDDGDASTVLSTLGVSTFIKTLLDDADAATARATLGANSASNLTTGTLPNARLSGAYSGITTLDTTGRMTVTQAGEALRLAGPNAADDPYLTFYAGGVRTAYIQHTDGTADGNGIRIFNDVTDDYLYLSNVNSTSALKFYDSSVATHNTVLTTGNYDALGVTPEARTITAGNGLTGGGDLSANRTLTLGTPSNITNSTTNSVTSTSHAHALGFIAAEVYTGTSATATSLPLGHLIMVYDSSFAPDRNESGTVRISDLNSWQYVGSTSSPALTGTWRSRGGLAGGSSNARATLMQRVA